MAVTPLVILPSFDLKKEKEKELDPLTIYCLPVSGGGFVAQLGLLSELFEAKRILKDNKIQGSKDYQPDIVLAASGGNVATYIAMAGDWSPEGILRTALKTNSSMFLKSWWPENLDFLPTWLLGIFNGSMYRRGCGAGQLFKSLYTTESIQRTEIWTGTYDQSNRRAQFFCNLSPHRSQISSDYFDETSHLYGCMPLKYLSGDLEKIAIASIASASIPVLVMEQELDGCEYEDGGTMYASPTTVMASEIYRLIMGANPHHLRLQREVRASVYKDNSLQASASSTGSSGSSGQVSQTLRYSVDKKNEVAEIKAVAPIGTGRICAMGQRSLRLVYFCAYEMDVPKGQGPASSQMSKIPSLAQFIHANILQDRSSAINILYRICGDESINIQFNHYPKINKRHLSDILKNLEQQRHYVMILYPNGGPTISLIRYTPADIEKQIDLTRSSYGAYTWHFPYPKI